MSNSSKEFTKEHAEFLETLALQVKYENSLAVAKRLDSMAKNLLESQYKGNKLSLLMDAVDNFLHSDRNIGAQNDLSNAYDIIRGDTE